MRMTIAQSEALVKSQLGRYPQDSLEAAAVLEAWGGVSSPFALKLARDQFTTGKVRAAISNHSVPPKTPPTAPTHVWGLLLTILVTAAWLTPPYPGDTVRVAWLIAIPITQMILGVMHRRFLGSSPNLERLRNNILSSAILFFSILFMVAVTGEEGALAACMIIIWVSSVVVVYRGWGIPYAGLTGAASIYCVRYAPYSLIPVMVFLAALAAAIAIWTTESSPQKPAPLLRVVPTAIYSLALGFLIVLAIAGLADIHSNFFVLALVPTFTASYWASRQLWKYWRILPERMRLTPMGSQATFSKLSWRILTSTMLRYFLAVSFGSFLLLGFAALTEQSNSELIPILSSLAVLGLIALCAQILDGFGHPYYAATGLLAALTVALTLQFGLDANEFSTMVGAFIAMMLFTAEMITHIFSKPVFTLARPR